MYKTNEEFCVMQMKGDLNLVYILFPFLSGRKMNILQENITEMLN